MITTTQDTATTGKAMALGTFLVALMAAKPAHASTTFTVNSTRDKSDLDFPGGVFYGSSDGKCFTGDVLVVQGEECTLRAAEQEPTSTNWGMTVNATCATAR